jgi:mRNA interferase RelE/StbE
VTRYTVEIKRSAEREMDRLSEDVHRRITEGILALETNPRPPASRKLRGGKGYRVRIGDYRVLYTTDDEVRRILVYSVAHRREAYR